MGRDDREMTAEEAPDLDRARVALRGASSAAQPALQDGMFAALQAEAAREDATWIGALRAKPTSVRRIVALCSLSLIVAVDLVRHAAAAVNQEPVRVLVALAVFGALTVTLLLASLRPMHRPAFSARAQAWFLGGSLIVALALNLWPGADPAVSLADSWRDALPCLRYGLAVGVVVYVVARMADRGSWSTGLLAALAAGLSANFVLMTHCPSAGADHMLLGHFGVIAALLLAWFGWSRVRFSR